MRKGSFRQWETRQSASDFQWKLAGGSIGLSIVPVIGTLIKPNTVCPGRPASRFILRINAHCVYNPVVLPLVESLKGVGRRIECRLYKKTRIISTLKLQMGITQAVATLLITYQKEQYRRWQ